MLKVMFFLASSIGTQSTLGVASGSSCTDGLDSLERRASTAPQEEPGP